MKRIPILLIPVLICWLQFGFAQTSASVAEKQDPLQDSVEKYEKLKEFKKVLPFSEQWVEKLKRNKKESGIEYGVALNSLGNALNRTGKSKDAEPIMLQALEIRKKVLGQEHPDIARLLHNLGILYDNWGDYAKSESYKLQALEIRKKALGPDHPDVAASLNSLGILNLNIGKYSLAESYFLDALELDRKVNGPEDPKTATTLNNLGVLFVELGKYAMAEPYYLEAFEIRKKRLSPEHQDVAQSNNNLGAMYYKMGDYAKTEPYFLKALEIYYKILGPDHPDVAIPLSNLSALYNNMADYANAEYYGLRALEIRKKANGPEHIYVSASLNNMGALYYDMGKYDKAESAYKQALEIRKKVLGPNHLEVGATLNNLGLLYADMDNYAKAELFHLQALEIKKKVFYPNAFGDGTSLNNLGNLYWKMGRFTQSEQYYLQALEIRKRVLTSKHPDVATTLNNLGVLFHGRGDFSKSEGFFLDWSANKMVQIQRYFPFLSDKEKTYFFDLNLSKPQANFFSFCVDRYTGNKAIAGPFYNDQIAIKGLLLSSAAKWRHRIKTAGDKKLNRLFDDWETNRNKLIQLLQSTDTTERAGMDSLEKKTEKMEKELSLRSENFAKLADKQLVTWRDVLKTLKPGEAAIEMIRVKKFGIEKTITDTSDPKKPTYKVKGQTDTIYYAALIVKPKSAYPEMVLLKNGNDLEGKHLKFYQNSISRQIPDNQTYGYFWEKIGAKLGKTTRIYFSPDGVFYQINLNTLFNPKTKKYLMEEKDIRLLTSTKDLVNPGLADENNKLADLVGFPTYYSSGSAVSREKNERRSPKMRYGLRLESMGTLAELPGTKTEVDKVASILEAKGWEVKNYTQENALETNIKESYKPRLLHIATHGFFQPDSTKGSNPLLRSGLMLTGAGSTLKGEKNETGEDGILTAYEAMNLNLDNTDLVVLSACETGLGEIKNGEGVYGLQRAFKVAGARSLIMSLWKVDDEATQELMVSFYKHWLSSPSQTLPKGKGLKSSPYEDLDGPGSSKRLAFLKAQKELKAKYPQPYYWGAFVMVGE